MNAKTLEAIKRHGESLLTAFPNATEKDPVALCKKLRRIETSLTKPLTDYCNGDLTDDVQLDQTCNTAIDRVRNLLGMSNGCGHTVGLFVNRDPRGYALKLSDEWTRNYNRKMYRDNGNGCLQPIYTDMGGYGIIAPDLTTK